jgi:hypothetical protein
MQSILIGSAEWTRANKINVISWFFAVDLLASRQFFKQAIPPASNALLN